MNWIDRLERKYRRFAINGLVKYLVIGAVFVFAALYLGGNSGGIIVEKLSLNRSAILRGEIWRLVTFVFIPPTFNIFIVFVLYLFYMFGNALDSYWGSFRLNLYYVIGVVSAIAVAFITSNGIGTAEFLNMSIFLAFAYLYPNFELLLFFILPVKVKYLAWFNVLYIVFSIAFRQDSYIKIAAALSFVNFFLFFGNDIMDRWISSRIKKMVKKHKRKKLKIVPPQKPRNFELVLKCKECGRTSKEHPELIFAYCPRCGSDYVYCHEHLNNHKHMN